MAAVKKTETIELRRPDIQTLPILLIGDSPLICHAWSKKAREQMLAKQMKKASPGRAAKDPWKDFCETLYWLDGLPEEPTEHDVETGRFGFPSIAFKGAAITACTSDKALTKVGARQAFHISGEFIEINGRPAMREDMVRIGMGTADIRHRAEFETWSALVPVQFNANVMSAEQVANLFELAGFAVGIGEWRPEKNGSNGRFHVARDGERV